MGRVVHGMKVLTPPARSLIGPHSWGCVGLGCLRTSVLTIQDGGIMHLGADFTTKTNSLVGRASVMIADDAGSIPAQSTIFMTFLHGSSNSLWGELFME